ncbi:MAG: putative sulfate exporter family transporter, partial [Actinomycetota bacterium]
WVGASVHDTAQVVAAASAGGTAVLAVAVAVKLTRILLLAPIVTLVNLRAARRLAGHDATDARLPAYIPPFVAAFLACVLIRTTGALPDWFLDAAKTAEGLMLAAAMVALGASVDLGRIRSLGIRPLALGTVSWLGVAGVSFAAVWFTG